MRKSIDGLCAIIKELMDEDQPDGRSLYLFLLPKADTAGRGTAPR